MFSTQIRRTIQALMAFSVAMPAVAQPYDLSWHTVDGGGAMFSVGATYTLGGTIGQPDAGFMSGGNYTLTGGFWAGASIPQTGVTIVSADPPLDNPWLAGTQPFMDVLDTGPGSTLTAGIGGSGTAPQGAYTYSPISVTFSQPPSPQPALGFCSNSAKDRSPHKMCWPECVRA